jgi:hypothetical protein
MTETQTPDYPTEYRGNTIYDEKRVKELSPDNKPDLQLVECRENIDHVLDHIGVEYDRDSIVLEDSYNCLWVDTFAGEYSEVWGIHKCVPYNELIAVRLR